MSKPNFHQKSGKERKEQENRSLKMKIEKQKLEIETIKRQLRHSETEKQDRIHSWVQTNSCEASHAASTDSSSVDSPGLNSLLVIDGISFELHFPQNPIYNKVLNYSLPLPEASKCMAERVSDRMYILCGKDRNQLAIFDFSQRSWIRGPSKVSFFGLDQHSGLPIDRKRPILVNFGKHLFILGGENESRCQKFDCHTSIGNPITSMPSHIGASNLFRSDGRAVRVGDSIVVIKWNTTGLTEGLIYRPMNNHWSPFPDEQQKVWSLCNCDSILQDSEITSVDPHLLYLSGGLKKGSLSSKKFKRMDTREGKWNDLSPMMTGRYSHSLVDYNESIMAIGGIEEMGWGQKRKLKSVEQYDNRNDKWIAVESLDREMSQICALCLNSEYYVNL